MLKRIESGITSHGFDFGCLSFIKDFATQFGLVGTVFIKHDGSIKIIAEGEEEDLIKFAEKIKHQISIFAIENFYEVLHEPTGEFEDFSISPK